IAFLPCVNHKNNSYLKGSYYKKSTFYFFISMLIRCLLLLCILLLLFLLLFFLLFLDFRSMFFCKFLKHNRIIFHKRFHFIRFVRYAFAIFEQQVYLFF